MKHSRWGFDMLHGKIEVNEVAVGYWEAVNVQDVFTHMGRYDCKLFYRNNEGHPLHAEFEIVHWTGDGAVALAQRVLAVGMKKLKGYPPGGPKEFPV